MLSRWRLERLELTESHVQIFRGRWVHVRVPQVGIDVIGAYGPLLKNIPLLALLVLLDVLEPPAERSDRRA